MSDAGLIDNTVSRLWSMSHDYITANPNIVGGVDIYNVANPTSEEQLGAIAATVLGVFDTESGRRAIQRIVVVGVPDADLVVLAKNIKEDFIATLRHYRGESDAELEETLLQRVEVIKAKNYETSSMLDIIQSAPKRAALVIADADRYRDPKIVPFVLAGSDGPRLPEDVWVPQVHWLAAASLALVKEQEKYVALVVEQYTPGRMQLASLLTSMEGVGVIGSSSEASIEAQISSKADEWDGLIAAGRIGRVLKAIDSLPASMDRHKGFLRVQMLHRAGLLPQALAGVREELASGQHIDPQSGVKLARIAVDAGASALGKQMLSLVVDRLTGLEDLETALATAMDGDIDELEGELTSRLAARFPESRGLAGFRVRELSRARKYGDAAAVLRGVGEDIRAGFFDRLAAGFAGDGIPDYTAVVATAGGDAALANALRVACARDALRRQLPIHAADLILPLPKTRPEGTAGATLLIDMIEAAFLAEGSGAPPLPEGWFETALQAAIEHLADDPTNQVLRAKIARVLQPQIAGDIGLALVLHLVLRVAAKGHEVEEGPKRSRAGMSWLSDHEAFVATALDWLQNERAIVLGRASFPKELLTESADDFTSALASFVTFAPASTEEDARVLQSYTAIGAAVAQHGADPDFDIRLLRLTAGKLASSGRTQIARDMAEQTLLNSAASSRRRRLGWFGMADVYHRLRDYLEAAICFSCALLADNVADEEESWLELYGLARLLRDCGLDQQAAEVLETSKTLLSRIEWADKANLNRLETLSLQIRHSQLSGSKGDFATLELLLDDAARNAVAVLDTNDTAAPVAVLLASLFREAKDAGAQISPQSKDVMQRLLARVEPNHQSLINAMTADAVSVDQIMQVVCGGDITRYSEDAGFDMSNIALIASLALSDDAYIEDPVAAALAVELLSDRGVASPGWDEVATPPPAPSSAIGPAEIAMAASQEGYSVVQAAFDRIGRVVTVATVNGTIKAAKREPVEAITQDRFKRWAEKYPYEYGIKEDDPNLFYTTTEDIRLSARPNRESGGSRAVRN